MSSTNSPPLSARQPLLPEVPLPQARRFAALAAPTPGHAEQPMFCQPSSPPRPFQSFSPPSFGLWPALPGATDAQIQLAPLRASPPPRSPLQNFARSGTIPAPSYRPSAPYQAAGHPHHPQSLASTSATNIASVPPVLPSWSRPSSDHAMLRQIRGIPLPSFLSTTRDPESDSDDDGTVGRTRRRRRKATETPRDAHLRRLPCPQCGKMFARPSALETHLRSHTKEAPFTCPDLSCGRAFAVQSNMRRHVRLCHSALVDGHESSPEVTSPDRQSLTPPASPTSTSRPVERPTSAGGSLDALLTTNVEVPDRSLHGVHGKELW